MKSAVETVSPTRVRLTVEVPFEELKPSLDSAYRSISRQINVPGFRRGKVPARIIDQRVGRGAVLEEAVNDALPRFYGQAVDENAVKVVGQPEVEVTEFADASDLKFTAEVDVRPTIELPSYDALPIAVADAEVSDEDVDAGIEQLRERFGTLVPVDRPVQDGDFVSLDLSAAIGGEVLEDGTATGLSYQVGSGGMVEGLDATLVGMTAGSSATFETSLAGGPHAGEQAEVTVAVNSVKERELPELDDAFAELASEFDTLEELRADVRRQLEQVKRFEQGTEARDKTVDALLALVDMPLPESLVTAETEMRRDAFTRQLEMSGMTLESYLAAQGQTAEDFDNEIVDSARKAIATQLLLDEIVAKEQLSVSEPELSAHIVRRASRAGVSPDDFARSIVEHNQVQALVAEVVRGKALGVVLERAVVTDESGRPVDLEAIAAEADPAALLEGSEAPDAEAEVEGVEVADPAAGEHAGQEHSGHEHSGHEHGAGHEHDAGHEH